MSQTMSTSTNALLKSLSTASRASSLGSLTTFQVCSRAARTNFYSTSTETTSKALNDKTHSNDSSSSKSKEPYTKPKALKQDGISIGFIMDASLAPTVTDLLNKRVSKRATERIPWSHSRVMFGVPLAHLPSLLSWCTATASTQSPFSVKFPNASCLSIKQKAAFANVPPMERVQLHADSPALAAIGDSLNATLKKEVKEAMSPKLHKIVNKPESRWAVHYALVAKEAKKDIPKYYTELTERFAEGIGKEEVKVTGVWMQKAEGGVKELLSFPFKG